jgi:signal transduction histidine kinase
MKAVTLKSVSFWKGMSQALKKSLIKPVKYPDGGLSWLITLRWVACLGLFIVIWLASSILKIIDLPLPLYLTGIFLSGYNLVFWLIARRQRKRSERWLVNILSLQITLDLVALTVLLYFSGISHNPFIFYYAFHIIIAGILLPGTYAYLEAGLASGMVGMLLLFQYLSLIPEYNLNLPYLTGSTEGEGIYFLGKFIALSTALFFSAYFTVSMVKGIRSAEAEIRQKEKFLSLGQLVSGIVHQIKNPLDGLKNCLHHIGKGTAGEDGADKFINLMRDELERIELLAYRLQDYARPHIIEIQPVNVNQEVGTALKLIEISNTGEVRIQTELGNIPRAKGDPFALQEVVINLSTNAIAAMPAGGTLTIRTYPTPLRFYHSMNGVGIDIADTGKGLSREEIELIFEPFYTTKPSSEGTGLGLWICQMLVSQMGGAMEVASVPGRGSTFKVLLQAY